MGACAPSEILVLNLDIVMCPLNATALSRILDCKPSLIAKENNMTIVLMAIAVMPIFIIGPETLLL